MQITKKQLTPTNVQLTIVADATELLPAKQAVLKDLAKDLKLAGFRKGHAPAHMVEKVVDQQLLQNNVIDHVVNDLYMAGIEQEKLRPASQPEVSLTKFVPYATLEMTAVFDVVGSVKLPDYTKFKVHKNVDAVTDEEVEAVLDDILARDATTKEVERAAQDGDEVVIDFAGADAKSKEPIEGAKGEDYPLVIGSNTFIPGFEPEVVGLKKDDEKTFTITFPKDYAAKELQHKKVAFTITVKAVRERTLPKLDDAFAAKLGAFTSVAELRNDIRKQLVAEKDAQAQRKLESDVLEQLGSKAVVELPDSLIEQEIDRIDEEERRNLMYRGQTWQEHLDAEGKTEEEHRAGHREQAALRVTVGIALGEVAQKEKVEVTDDEFTAHLETLKKQYGDAQMQAELAKPENQRDILSRMMTEKTVAVLVAHATAK